jgi:hypothetical protein
VVPNSTHYTPIEYPREVAAELTRWLDEVTARTRSRERTAVAR